jgi:hypothetical protein
MISTLTEYLNAIEALKLPDSQLSSTTLPWYRGQGDASWNLVPSMYRGDWDVGREREMARDFQLRALLDMDHHPIMYIGWLFVMQHHGMPTRLLDWTESSLVALYFAVENHAKAGDAAVWVMHPWNLNQAAESFGQKSVPHLTGKINRDYLYPMNTVASASSGPPTVAKKLPMALRPAHTSKRIIAQRGQFTIHGSQKDGLDQIPSSRAKIRLQKIDISGSRKLAILQELYKAGVSRYSLFPDLDGLSREISIRYSKAFMK